MISNDFLVDVHFEFVGSWVQFYLVVGEFKFAWLGVHVRLIHHTNLRSPRIHTILRVICIPLIDVTRYTCDASILCNTFRMIISLSYSIKMMNRQFCFNFFVNFVWDCFLTFFPDFMDLFLK